MAQTTRKKTLGLMAWLFLLSTEVLLCLQGCQAKRIQVHTSNTAARAAKGSTSPDGKGLPLPTNGAGGSGSSSGTTNNGNVADSGLKPAKVDPIPVDSTPSNTLYVSPDGSGTECSREKPCALTQARASLRQKNAEMQTDLTVYLRGGQYEISSSFVLEPEDSGRNGKFVVYSSFPGEVPIISGGSSVKGWTLHDANKGIYKAQVPDGTDARQLYVDGVRATRARSNVDSAAYTSLDSGWRTDDGGMASWRNITSIEVGSRVAWKSFRCPLSAIGNGWRNAVASSSGIAFNFAGDWLKDCGIGAAYSLGDFNVDAKIDLLFSYQDGSSWRNSVALSSGSSFAGPSEWLFDSGRGTKYSVGDFNGDGKSDLLFAYQDGTTWRNVVALSSGSSFSLQGDWMSNVGQGVPYLVGDFDGDRKSDLLFAYQDGTSWRNIIAKSSGTSFAVSGDWLTNAGLWTTYHTGDFSGDGKDDLLFAYPDAKISIQEPCWTNANRQQGVSMRQQISWIENAYELLNEPGEWYLDKPARTVYYLPRAGEILATAAVVMPRLDTLIDGRGRLAADGSPTFLENIKFIGIVFAYAGWIAPNSSDGYAELQAGMHSVGTGDLVRIPGNLTFSTVRNLQFLRNRFLHLGGSGLNIEGGSQSVTIVGNVFADISGSGLQVGSVVDPGETRTEKQHRDVTIANNYVTSTGVEYESTTGIFLGYVADAVLEHNEVFALPYTGISVGWGWGTPSYARNNKLARNYIHRVMQTLRDGGGIYTLSAQPDSGLTENFIEEVGFNGCSGGYNSIYHDEGSQFFVDRGNVVKNSCEFWLSLWTESVQNNTLTGNFVDFDRVYCNHGPGTSERCAFGNNNVSGNLFNGGNWPAEAGAVMNAAGLEADYQSVKEF